MKKTWTVAIVILMAISLTSCGKEAGQDDSNSVPSALSDNKDSIDKDDKTEIAEEEEEEKEEEKWVLIEEIQTEVYGDNLDQEYIAYKIQNTYDSDGKFVWSDEEEFGFDKRTIYIRSYDEKGVMFHCASLCITLSDNEFYSFLPKHTYNTYAL